MPPSGSWGRRVESVRVAPAPGVAVYYMLADM